MAKVTITGRLNQEATRGPFQSDLCFFGTETEIAFEANCEYEYDLRNDDTVLNRVQITRVAIRCTARNDNGFTVAQTPWTLVEYNQWPPEMVDVLEGKAISIFHEYENGVPFPEIPETITTEYAAK